MPGSRKTFAKLPAHLKREANPLQALRTDPPIQVLPGTFAAGSCE